jgi:hypothetical protein
MDPVLDHRADAHQEHPLAQNLLADPLLLRPDVRGRQQIATSAAMAGGPRTAFDASLSAAELSRKTPDSGDYPQP